MCHAGTEGKSVETSAPAVFGKSESPEIEKITGLVGVSVKSKTKPFLKPDKKQRLETFEAWEI